MNRTSPSPEAEHVRGFPWSRQRNESEVAYAAFRVYIELPPETRSYNEVAEIVGKHVSLMKRWGSVHDWQERTRLYDNYVQKAFDTSNQALLEEYKLRVVADEIKDYQKLRDIWNHVMEVSLENMLNGDLDVKDLERLVNTRLRIDELARRAARMPNNYKDDTALLPEETEEEQFVLTLDSPAIQLASESDG